MTGTVVLLLIARISVLVRRGAPHAPAHEKGPVRRTAQSLVDVYTTTCSYQDAVETNLQQVLLGQRPEGCRAMSTSAERNDYLSNDYLSNEQ